MASYQILQGDWIEQLKALPSESVQCVVTSPPYWGLRDYGVSGQFGLEKTPEEYVKKVIAGFREVKRVLRKDGVLFLNLGDSYWGGGGGNYGNKIAPQHGQHLTNVKNRYCPDGLKPKDLVGIPWRVAFALQADGWWLRQDIIWAKPNPMPESVTDRCTKSHEYIFLLTKNAKYFYDNAAIFELAAYDGRIDMVFKGSNKYDADTLARAGGERWPKKIPYRQKHEQYGLNKQAFNSINSADGLPARNKRDVWFINTQAYTEAHFATFPPEIPWLCISAGSKEGDTILDPFTGSGTTGEVALKLNRNFIGIELNEKYVNDLIIPRLENVDPLFKVMDFN